VSDSLLRVVEVSKSYRGLPALAGVSLTVDRGCALGLVGGSGSGKSTLARLIARFDSPDAGDIRIEGRSDYPRHEVQLIFQEAAASLNPRFTAGELLEEPLLIRNLGSRDSRRRKAAEWLEAVGLAAGAARKPALAFSGGERQRLAIARALIGEPKLLILDESFSGLDLVLQAQLTALLLDLRRRLGLTCILISHDLTLAARVSDEIAVLSAGALVERAPGADLLAHPSDPAAVALVEASRALTLKGALA
jgi:ABC-type dipeptide/oligopeptide/nickel transport system ATPase subunit